MSHTTHLATLEKALRDIANRSDLGKFNTQFFLRATFITDLALFVQQKEQEAFQRGLQAQLSPSENKTAAPVA